MCLIKFINNLLRRIFGKENDLQLEEPLVLLEEDNLSIEEIKQEEVKPFKLENVVFDKLNYLEQYIKIFSLTFPKEYREYLTTIQKLKADYVKELEEFKKGFEGDITFSIDPEQESKRYVEATGLEYEIKAFVESEVDYKACKNKFSELCYKLNLFYNTLIDTNVEKERIITQLNNAYASLEALVKDLNNQEFFRKDSRKKDDILSYVIYSDYIIFKSFIRVGIISHFDEYKQEISKIYSFFMQEDYDMLIFKFFIESLEQIQNMITEKLNSDKMYQYVLKECQNLQQRMDDCKNCFNDYTFFANVVKLENTIDSLLKLQKAQFTFDVSQIIDFAKDENEIISINNIAKSMLSLVDNEKARLLEKIVNNFTIEISWREFYFLCKIFELADDIVKASDNTVFSMVKDQFIKLGERYAEYSDEYVKREKDKILNYQGSKSKKYILLLKLQDDTEDVTSTLKSLSLDFAAYNHQIYLNHSYFNGFMNLEQNFGQYITL